MLLNVIINCCIVHLAPMRSQTLPICASFSSEWQRDVLCRAESGFAGIPVFGTAFFALWNTDPDKERKDYLEGKKIRKMSMVSMLRLIY